MDGEDHVLQFEVNVVVVFNCTFDGWSLFVDYPFNLFSSEMLKCDALLLMMSMICYCRVLLKTQ